MEGWYFINIEFLQNNSNNSQDPFQNICLCFDVPCLPSARGLKSEIKS